MLGKLNRANGRSLSDCSAARNELGDFLRSRRKKLDPLLIDHECVSKRRTSGLRREEVAERAGISADWYIRLEQGRMKNPPKATIDALARALCMTKAEHTHMRVLLRAPDRRLFIRETVPNTLQRLVRSLANPAYVAGRRWDLLAWNEAAEALFTDLSWVQEADRNILLHMFTALSMKQLFGSDWTDEARRMLALFRTSYDLWAGDPAFESLLSRLQASSPQFERWWQRHDVAENGGVRKTLHHATQGLLYFETLSFQTLDNASLRLVIYTPVEAS